MRWFRLRLIERNASTLKIEKYLLKVTNDTNLSPIKNK